MKALTTFIAIALLAFSTTACSQQHTYRSGGFGSKTVKASKNYVTKDIKVDNFTKLSVAGSPDVTYTQKSGKPTVEVIPRTTLSICWIFMSRTIPSTSASRRTSAYPIINWKYVCPQKS